jgi:hypothetical protein
VRRALTMAIDRQQIVDGFVYGYGEVGRGTVWPAHFAYDGDDPETFIPHDPLQAARILDEAGWRRGRDGIRRNADGVPFRFDLITNQGNETRKDIIEYVQAQLAPLGIDARPRLIEWTTMLDQLRGSVNAEGVRERNFDAVVSSWVDAFAKNDADQLHSRGIDNPHQYVGYSNPEVDRYLDTLQVITDRDEARPFWREYERIIAREAPYTVLYFPQRLSAVRNRVRDVEMDVRGRADQRDRVVDRPGTAEGAMSVQRRDFLRISGAGLAGLALGGGLPRVTGGEMQDWEAVRAAFRLDPSWVHLTGLYLASHPDPVRTMVERYRTRSTATLCSSTSRT